jgi:hypothetical protein
MMEQRLQETVEEPALAATDRTPVSDTPLSEREVNQLTSVLKQRAKRRNFWHWVMALSAGSAAFNLLIAVLVMLWFVVSRQYWPEIGFDVMDWSGGLSVDTPPRGPSTVRFGGPWFLFGFVSSVGYFAARRVWRKQEKETRRLAELNDLRTVGTLAEALGWEDAGIRAIAESALTPLLPQLKATDAYLIDDHQRTSLRKALSSDNEGLILAVLQSFEQIGDGSDVEEVEKLASGQGRAATNEGIRRAAEQCLPYLRQRLEQEKARRSLLRPTENTAEYAAELLRPAGVAESDPDHLLRIVTQ